MSIRRVAALLVLAVVAIGCVADPPALRDVPRDESGAVIEAGEVGSQKVRVGDCIEDVESGQLASVTVVPCDELHVYEAFHEFEVDREEHPGQFVIADLAEQHCLGAFEHFVGVPYSQSVYAISYFWPTDDTWDRLADRRVLCLLVRADETPNVGSSRDSAQ